MAVIERQREQPQGPPEEPPFVPTLSEAEEREVQKRRSIRPDVVHEAVRKEGEEELQRTTGALAWSGLAAGLSMGFSLVAEGLLRSHLPDQPWRPLITKLGYSFGYLIVILGRQQLFTENTLTVVLPLLARRDARTLAGVLRLWAVVLAANMLGAVVFAWGASRPGVFAPDTQRAFAGLARAAWVGGFGVTMVRGVMAGWLIALLVWLLPSAHTARVPVIVLVTYIIGLASFTHIIAGSIEVLYGVMTGATTWGAFLGGYMLPTLLGNAVGGVTLVAVVNHAQVVTGGSGQ